MRVKYEKASVWNRRFFPVKSRFFFSRLIASFFIICINKCVFVDGRKWYCIRVIAFPWAGYVQMGGSISIRIETLSFLDSSMPPTFDDSTLPSVVSFFLVFLLLFFSLSHFSLNRKKKPLRKIWNDSAAKLKLL